MGDDVVGQLVGELLDLRLTAFGQVGVLPFEFGHRLRPCAAGRLVGGHVHAADVRHALDGLQRHHHLNGGAVGVGDDAARSVERVASVDFGHDQRYVGLHAEGARIVDHQRSVAGDRPGEFARRARSGRREGNVHAAEVVVVSQQLDGDGFPAEHIGLSGAAFRSEQQQFVHRQGTLFENAQELLTYGAARADDCDFHGRSSLSVVERFGSQKDASRSKSKKIRAIFRRPPDFSARCGGKRASQSRSS